MVVGPTDMGRIDSTATAMELIRYVLLSKQRPTLVLST